MRKTCGAHDEYLQQFKVNHAPGFAVGFIEQVRMGRLLWSIQPLGRHPTLLVVVSLHCLVGLDCNESGSFACPNSNRNGENSLSSSQLFCFNIWSVLTSFDPSRCYLRCNQTCILAGEAFWLFFYQKDKEILKSRIAYVPKDDSKYRFTLSFDLPQ